MARKIKQSVLDSMPYLNKEEDKKRKIKQSVLDSMPYLSKDNEDDDIAPVGGDKNTWFKSGGFSDGVDGVGDFFGDLGETVLGTAGDIGFSMVKGAGRMVEGLVDLGTYGVAQVGDWLGEDEFAEKARNVARYNAVDEWISPVQEFGDRNSVLGNKADAVAEGLGQVGAIILTGGTGAAAGLGSAGVTALTTGLTGLSSMGTGMGEAYENDATDGEAFLYGLGSGAIEAGTELLFGGLGKGVKALGMSRGIGGLDDMFAKKLSSVITKSIGNKNVQKVLGNTLEYAVKSGGEGVEEVLSGLGSAVMKKLTYENDESLGKLIEDENLLEQFVVGAITSSIAQGADFVKANASGRDFVTGYTDNEQAVIDKEVRKRVFQQQEDGTVLTSKEIGAIEESVRDDLEHGQIDIEMIDEVLGGESYKAYREAVEAEEDAKLEYEELANIKKSDLTTAQEKRLAELEAMNLGDTTKRDELRKKLNDTVFPQLKDSKLAESYNQAAKRRDTFKADLSKYKGKQREAVERAVKSGVLNDTYRSHVLVDTLSRIEADKGITFDYTSNEKLRESGFAVEGKIVNGYANKNTGSVTLNVQSAQAWQSVVGHEITHVLEGTEAYTALRETLYKYAESKGELESRRSSLTELYRDLGADVESELTADLVGDYLFSDKAFIDRLTGNRTLFQKIYDEIKYLYSVATGKERASIERVKREFDRALKEYSANGVAGELDSDVSGKSGEEAGKAQYSLDAVEAVQPKSDKWARTHTTEEAMTVFPDMWNVSAEESEVRNPTQITSTVNTYRKIYNLLQNEGFDGKILDASSGLGYGTRAGVEEYGFDVEDIEPYPDANYKPKYQDYSALDEKYDVIISNAVLNVLPQDQRDALTVKMGELLNDGGRLFVNVRGKDVETLAKTGKNIHLGNMEWIETVKGSYQKGFTKPELVAYLQDALGEGFTVKPTNAFGGVAAVVTKDGGKVQYSVSEDRRAEIDRQIEEDAVAESKSNEEAFADSATAVQYSIRPPYSDGSKAFDEFSVALSPEAKSTFDMFYGFYQKSRITNALSVSGKRVKGVNISSLYLRAQEWNDMLSADEKWRAAAQDLADFLPKEVRERMRMNPDGTLIPNPMEEEFKMPSSLAQRLVDSLPYEMIDATYTLGDKTITLPEGKARQSVGGESYRRAIINETRKLFREGKLKQVGIGTMSKDRWGSLGFLAANGKTGASGDFTTVCPQMMFNRGCWYCYRRAAMEKGVNNKLVANNVWYTGEILRIKDSDIKSLNENGGLRIQSFGDWMPHFSAMLADVLYDAEQRGLQVKIITKEPSMINYIAALREQGIGKNLYFNLSADYTIEEASQGVGELDAVNPERPFQRRNKSFWWKRAMTVEEANKYREKYPWVNTRIVATDLNEFIRGLKDPRVDVVTGYHGNIREFERVDSTSGEHKVMVEALGDAGMPRFAYNPVTHEWVTEYEGKTQTHKRLAEAIAREGLQMEYYTKTCCITGRCASCKGKCGALARDFNIKNATNRDAESVAYWQREMQYGIEPEFGDMTQNSDSIAPVGVQYSLSADSDADYMSAVDRYSDMTEKSVFRTHFMERNQGMAEAIAKSRNQTETENFKKWFGESVVTNKDGEPLLVFRGTSSNNAVLDHDQKPIWFSNNVMYAEKYSKDVKWSDRVRGSAKIFGGAEKKVIPAYISIKNPADFGDTDAVFSDSVTALSQKLGIAEEDMRYVWEKNGRKEKVWETLHTSDMASLLSEYGYDGATAIEYGCKTWCVFDSRQVKSAVANSGKFNPNNPDIRKSLSEEGEEYAPVGNYSTPFRELALEEDVAPVAKSASASEATGLESIPVLPDDEMEDGAYEAITPMTEEEANAIQDAKVEADKAAEGAPKSRKQLHRNILDNIKATFSSSGYDFDDVLSKAKNLSTFSTVDNTPQRVMEKALGYKEGGVLADLTVNKVAQNESAGIRWLNSYTDRKNGLLAQISKQYRIKPGSNESAAAQMYAEGFYVNDNNEIIAYGDAELAQDFPDVGVQYRIKGLAHDPRIRQIYDETLKAINESRTRNAYPEIGRLDNYFLHFRAMDDTFSRLGLPFNPNDIRAKDLPTDLNGVTADLKPGQPYFASAMHRTGKRTSFDLLGGLERYLTSAKNQIYHIDDIQTLRALRNYIADTYGQANGLEGIDVLSEEEAQERIEMVYNSHLSTFAKFLNEEANVLAGKTALIDRGIEGIIGRRGMTFLDTVNRQVGSNMVGFNISSSLTNILPVTQAFAKTNKFDFVKAFAQTASNKITSIFGKSDGFAENSPVIIRRKGSDRFYRTPWQKAGDAGYVLMSAVDDISTELIARTKFNELTRKGMGEQAAHFETDKWVSRLLGDRSLGQQPQLFNSKTLGIFTKFQLEVRNQLDSQFYDTIQEAKVSAEDIENGLARNAKIAAKVTSTFVQLAVAQHLFGKAFESVAGYNPAFDIISTLATMFGFDDEEDSEDTVLDNIEQGFLALLEDLPYTSTFTGGRIPISNALPITELVKGVDQYGNEKSRFETVKEAAPYYFLPGGYGQYKKTKAGLKMFSDEHPVSGSYTNKGSLRFPVEDTPLNRAQAAIFGQYASENAREYFDEGYAPLEEKQIQEYIDVDIPIKDYWEYREGLKGLKKNEEKIDYIAGLDLPVSKKNILANNVLDRKEPVDLANYDDFSDYEEFDFATKNPEKYAFAKSVGGYSAYKTYTDDLNDIRADKDASGKTINGSRKEKVLQYINDLDADYYTKIILYKSEYPSDDTYNSELVNYITNQADLTYEEKVAVLTKLGFRVGADGQIYVD